MKQLLVVYIIKGMFSTLITGSETCISMVIAVILLIFFNCIHLVTLSDIGNFNLMHNIQRELKCTINHIIYVHTMPSAN